MNKILYYKKNDDLDNSNDDKKNNDPNNLDDDEILCNCNLCWITRLIMLVLPNNIFFRNPFVIFVIMFILPILFLITILFPFVLYITKNYLIK